MTQSAVRLIDYGCERLMYRILLAADVPVEYI